MGYGEVTSGADTPRCAELQGGRPSCAVGFQSLQRGRAERQPHQRGPAASQPKDSSGRVRRGHPAAGRGLREWLENRRQ